MPLRKRFLFLGFILIALIFVFVFTTKENEQRNDLSKIESVSHISSISFVSSSSSPVLSAPRFNKVKSATSTMWEDISVSSSELGKISELINANKPDAAFKFVKINVGFLDGIKEGDMVELAIPDAVAVTMHVTSTQSIEGGRAVIGHLSNFSEAYYIGFSYDLLGNIVGEITSEKHNYSIRSYGGKAVVFKVLIDVEKFKHDDF